MSERKTRSRKGRDKVALAAATSFGECRFSSHISLRGNIARTSHVSGRNELSDRQDLFFLPIYSGSRLTRMSPEERLGFRTKK
ncbi:hypothetical protein BST61_g10858 [Cercospora zeina]